MVMIRRLARKLVEEVPYLYKFPLLNIVDESSKFMLMTEFELICWFVNLKMKFESYTEDERKTLILKKVYQACYEAARLVK